MSTTESYIIESVVQFFDEIANFATQSDHLKCYRGHSNSTWENVPGLLREDQKGLEQNEKLATRDLIAIHPDEFSADHTMFDRLVRMQHFGLPTRLLDVSINPMVALYFATHDEVDSTDNSANDGVVTAFDVPKRREKYYDSDTVSCIANIANLDETEKSTIADLVQKLYVEDENSNGGKKIDQFNADPAFHKLHQFIRAEKPYFLPVIDPFDLFQPVYVHPKMGNRRIIAQAGGFIIYGLDLRTNIVEDEKIEETRFVIPKSKKFEVRHSLELLGITDSTLFPELDRAAKRISSKYRHSP